jgi:hypothetical protein
MCFTVSAVSFASGIVRDRKINWARWAWLVNIIVLWNTWYMQDALDELRCSGQEVRPEAVERLAPLRFQHINVHGRYHFTLPEAIAQGRRRPLMLLHIGHKFPVYPLRF